MSSKKYHSNNSLNTSHNAFISFLYLISYPFVWVFKNIKRWIQRQKDEGKEEDLSRYLPTNKDKGRE